MRPGFKRAELRNRYDVPTFHEDDWHEYSGIRTTNILSSFLGRGHATSDWLLNAGSGVYNTGTHNWKELSVDLFSKPITPQRYPVCSTVERLPFKTGSIGGIVCVGEVLAYCDPARAFEEFSRILVPAGFLACDFGSSRSARYWLRESYGRAADLITDVYNGSPEQTWVYSPEYIKSLLNQFGFRIEAISGTHTWSTIARRTGIPPGAAVMVQRAFENFKLPTRWADLITIVASRSACGK